MDKILDISNCDKEPVSFIASVQPHAVLFSFSRGDFRIHNNSENISMLFGVADVLHKRVMEFPIGKIMINIIEERFPTEEWSLYKEVYFKFEYQGQIFEAHAFEISGLIACEVESTHWFSLDKEITALEAKHFRQSHAIAKFKEKTNIEELGKDLCHEIRSLTGLERVMLYKFSPVDWHGLVISEDKTASAHSFLGHRFPSSDIPKPARDLYLLNKVRYIADSAGASIPVNPAINSASGKTIDLSHSRTRAVSPIHLEYLQNMGVKTSYSVAITVNGELWGLIACHSTKMLFINQEMRLICESLAEAFAIAVPLIESSQSQREQMHFTNGMFDLIDKMKDADDQIAQLIKCSSAIMDLFKCDGMAIVDKTNAKLAGFTPLKADLLKLHEFISSKIETQTKKFFIIDSLAELDEKWAEISEIASGVMAIELSHNKNSLFMLFRKEFRSTIVWGGDPRKLESRNYKGQINPRKSFQSWEEVVMFKSIPWSDTEIKGAQRFKKLIFDTIIANNHKNTELQEKLLNSRNK